MEKISISNSVKKIQVNESGDFITFDPRDQGFNNRFLVLLQEFSEKKDEYDKKLEEISAMPGDTDKQQIERALAAVRFNSELCDWMTGQINAVFQDDVKQKVFGDIIPTGEAWAEFLYQLAPIIQTSRAEQSDRVRKYTAKYKR